MPLVYNPSAGKLVQSGSSGKSTYNPSNPSAGLAWARAQAQAAVGNKGGKGGGAKTQPKPIVPPGPPPKRQPLPSAYPPGPAVPGFPTNYPPVNLNWNAQVNTMMPSAYPPVTAPPVGFATTYPQPRVNLSAPSGVRYAPGMPPSYPRASVPGYPQLKVPKLLGSVQRLKNPAGWSQIANPPAQRNAPPAWVSTLYGALEGLPGMVPAETQPLYNQSGQSVQLGPNGWELVPAAAPAPPAPGFTPNWNWATGEPVTTPPAVRWTPKVQPTPTALPDVYEGQVNRAAAASAGGLQSPLTNTPVPGYMPGMQVFGGTPIFTQLPDTWLNSMQQTATNIAAQLSKGMRPATISATDQFNLGLTDDDLTKLGYTQNPWYGWSRTGGAGGSSGSSRSGWGSHGWGGRGGYGRGGYGDGGGNYYDSMPRWAMDMVMWRFA